MNIDNKRREHPRVELDRILNEYLEPLYALNGRSYFQLDESRRDDLKSRRVAYNSSIVSEEIRILMGSMPQGEIKEKLRDKMREIKNLLDKVPDFA